MWPFQRDADIPPLSLEAGLSRYFDLKDDWLKSTCRDRLMGLLEQHKPPGGWQITKAVVVGVGDFLSVRMQNSKTTSQKRDMLIMQLVVFLDIIDYLKDEDVLKFRVFAQELDWCDTELEMLDFLHVQAVVDPEAQEMSGPGVFTFAPCCPADVELVAQCVHRQPSLHLGIPVCSMMEREKSFDLHYVNGSLEDARDDAEIALWQKRQVRHGQRINLLKSYQETHDEVEFPRSESQRNRMSNASLRFQFKKRVVIRDSADESGSCEMCAGGRRFAYRDHLNDSMGNRRSSCYIE